MIKIRPKRALGLTLATITLSTVLAACGGGGDDEAAQDTTAAQPASGSDSSTTSDNSSTSGTTAAADFNDADVTFVQTMIPHHDQALKMSAFAEKNASRDEVKKLAADIKAAQAPEAAKLRGWLSAWGKTESGGAMAGMDHGAGGMAGMTSDTDMAAMEKATGAEFEKTFLKAMIEHHRGAIESAKTEQAQGKNADAKALADDVVADQSAEIDRMQKLLDTA